MGAGYQKQDDAPGRICWPERDRCKYSLRRLKKFYIKMTFEPELLIAISFSTLGLLAGPDHFQTGIRVAS